MTVLNTRYKQFKYLTRFFGLCNVPSTFQNYVNKSLQKFWDQFITTDLNNILVYKEHKEKQKKQISKALPTLYKR